MLKDEAYNKIIEMIYDGRFVYGQIYSINAISKELQMSRTPVRDAIMRLNNEGRLDLLPSRGFCLHFFDDDEFLPRLHLSNAIEGYCAYVLAQERKKGNTSENVLRLKSLLNRMQALDLDTVSFGEFTRLDNAFHQTLIGGIDQVNFVNLFSSQSGLVNTPELHLVKSPISYAEILYFHENIFNAIWAGDAPGAYSAMLVHSNAVYKCYTSAKGMIHIPSCCEITVKER